MGTVRRLTILLTVVACSCSEQAQDDPLPNAVKVVSPDIIVFRQADNVEFRSRLGHAIVLPKQFQAEDQGDTWLLTAPDGSGRITIVSFTVAGTGTTDEFREMLEKTIEKDGPFKESPWTPVRLANVDANTRAFFPVDGNKPWAFLLYVIRSGDYYHAIVVRASPTALALNRGFYGDRIVTFRCSSPNEGEG